MKTGMLGGTGLEGKALALRLGAAGLPIVIGSRSAARACAAAEQCNSILKSRCVTGAANPQMLTACDIVFLTLPHDQAASAVQGFAELFPPGLILVDVTVPMRFHEGRPEFVEPSAGSNAESIAACLPSGVHLVGAFKTIPAHVLEDLDTVMDCDLFVCGDSADAKARVMNLTGKIPSLRPVDAGPLAAARILERMTLLAVHLNRRYKSKGARFRVVGI